MTTEFSQLNLRPQLEQAVVDLGYQTPTPIQSATIPVMLTGKDVIGQAQTGTGKTAAFALPMLHNLNPDQRGVQGLVLAPTRELAIQVCNATKQFGAKMSVRILPVYGGQAYETQIRALKRGVDIVVGTPGRILDLIRKNVLDLSGINTFVLDEADEMLSMGFIEDIETILDQTPDSRQTALFSATMPSGIRKLAKRYMQNPQSITMEHKQLTVATTEQRYYMVNEKDKLAALTRLFEMEEFSSALVFARTRVSTGELANRLTVRGFPAEALNGDLSQDARLRVLNRFRQGFIKVLIATDVAARGLDIDDISHVFNYDLPLDPESYVHRIGRTGRAGKTGIAISLITPRERGRLRRIEAYSKQKISPATLPTADEIRKHREELLLNQVDVWIKRGRCRRERELVDQLVSQGHDLAEIAAISLKMARAEEKQRPIANINEVQFESSSRNTRKNGKRFKKRERRFEHRDKDMIALTFSQGKVHGLRPSDVVGTIASQADIPGSVIGKIRIQDKHTLVDVPEQYVGKILSLGNRFNFRKQTVTIERA